MFVGKVLDEDGRCSLGIVEHNEEEFYVEGSTPFQNANVVFKVKNIGPHKRLKRAYDLLTLNKALENLKYLTKEYKEDPTDYIKERLEYTKKAILLLIKNKDNQQNLSPIATMNLNNLHNLF